MITILDSRQALMSHEKTWRGLHQLSSEASPFMSWEWVATWIDCFGQQIAPFVVLWQKEKSPKAIFPLRLEKRGALRVLTFLHACPLTCPDHLGWIGNEADIPEATADLAIFLGASEAWDLLDIRELFPLEAVSLLVECLGKQRLKEFHWNYGNLPYLRLPPSWNDYLAGKQAKTRETLRRKERQADREGIDLELFDDPHQILEKLPVLWDLHSNRWSKGESTFLRTEVQTFHQKLLQGIQVTQATESSCGLQPRLYLLTTGAEALAMLYGFTSQNTFYYYQSGRIRPDKYDHLPSPGQVLLIKILQRLMADSYRFFDFLRGDENYKSHWTTEVRYDTRVVCAKGLRGRLAACAILARNQIANIVFRK